MQERKEGGDRAEAQQENKHNTIGKRFKAESEARTRTIALNPRLRGCERAGGRGRGQRTIGSVVVQVSFHFTRGEREGKYRRRSERSRRSANTGGGSLFFCALFGFIFAASVPPDRFSNEFREGGGKRGGEIEREREGCSRTGNEGREGGRVRDQRVGRSSPAYLRPTQITERARASPLGRTVVDERG